MFLLLGGPSISHLETLITKYQDSEICFATVNDFWLLEEKILSQIERRFDVVLASAEECNIPRPEHIEFWERDTGNVFISTRKAFGKRFDECFKDYGSKFLFFETDEPNIIRKVPTVDEPLTFRALSSFALMVFLLAIAGAKEMYLFGADGGAKSDGLLYYPGWEGNSWGRLAMDCRILNQAYPIIMKRICSLYGIKEPRIYNVSPNSNYTCFEKIGYEELEGL